MDLPVGLSLFGLGVVCASFVGVLVDRTHTGQSAVSGRSRCDYCGAPLPASSLVPVFSYLFLSGRSSCCGARLSLLAPVSELFLGGLFTASYFLVGLTIALPLMCISLALLLMLVLYDIRHHILPSLPLWLFVAIAALLRLTLSSTSFEFGLAVLMALLLSGALWLLHFGSQGRLIGFADVPLTFGLALFAGGMAFSGFIFSFWIGAVIGLLILSLGRKGSKIEHEVPFAPYLSAGFLLAHFTTWNPFDLIAALL